MANPRPLQCEREREMGRRSAKGFCQAQWLLSLLKERTLSQSLPQQTAGVVYQCFLES
uniref:Uncharacterized protein n=1 Tax=Rhizophora mucronata TaxID=61149 RepID=A0A2P2QFC3_RHIMU